MNQRHGWADPMDIERAQEVRDTIEAPTRAQGRDELHAWIQDQIDLGLITDRASMVDALTDAGFDLPRTGKAYITARDPDTGERWRLKGEIFHEDWQADRERYAPLPERDGDYVRDTAEIDPPLADDLALADRSDGADRDRLDDGRELFLDGAPDTLGADGTGPDADRAARRDLADPEPVENAAQDLHHGREARHLHSDRGGLDDPTDSLG